MTDPADGKFAAIDDVTNRFEGTIPSGRLASVKWRILDAERELMFQVPSLRKTVDEINAESAAAGDPDRVERVRTLVADKVLDIYRNPDRGLNQLTRTMPDITASRTWAPDPTRGRVQFTPDELDSVRLHTKRRKFGTIMVVPGHMTC
jgi:hypothetical protein